MHNVMASRRISRHISQMIQKLQCGVQNSACRLDPLTWKLAYNVNFSLEYMFSRQSTVGHVEMWFHKYENNIICPQEFSFAHIL